MNINTVFIYHSLKMTSTRIQKEDLENKILKNGLRQSTYGGYLKDLNLRSNAFFPLRV